MATAYGVVARFGDQSVGLSIFWLTPGLRVPPSPPLLKSLNDQFLASTLHNTMRPSIKLCDANTLVMTITP